MTVKRVLKGKAGGIVTVPPGTTLLDAVKRLAEHRIGTVVVTPDGGRVAGILSERDVAREVARRGASALEMPVEEAMTTEVETCTAEDTARGVLERMTEGRFRHMPVLEDGALAGLISLGDIVKYRLEEVRDERNALRDFVTGG
ncbi:CBS domain protein [Hasllibacter halocynthiae]|uniref:CBS domain protein n=1 Tax=Hasllibacter halocynthiae TaxID=595589 RepID=A0A2T0X9A4_9RHOB|nr:CBS domain-containing protein [Hasllibacter halocynthiae]PRY95528.1 CBS domain protein [Hasllibacter halocynthiae]